MSVPFHDRRDAGQQLAAKLRAYAKQPDVLVLGLPRGGVPVAYEVARALDAPMDVFLVRKLGVPGHEELAMGAIATGGVRVLNEEVVEELRMPEDVINAVVASEQRELTRRERLYRGTRSTPDVQGRVVILVDDGLATGSTMRAAILAVREQQPKHVIAAVPVASAITCDEFQHVADETVCAITPEPFYAVGLWYEDFAPTGDHEVRDLLARVEEVWGRGGGVSDGAEGTEESGSQGGRSDSSLNHKLSITLLDSSTPRLLDLIGDARYVLIGEASHGTHEFYRERAEITKRLIEERGVTAVAVEADWPDAYRVNRYVRGQSNDVSANEALGDFKRFPQWMWRNSVVLDFVTWLREYNNALPPGAARVGFYGLDLYSLNASIGAVVSYLDRIDPEAAQRARARYACFDHFGDDAQAYGYATGFGTAEPCEDEVVNQLLELQRRAADLASRDGRVAEDEFFYAEQNARLAMNAEAYYRSMFRGRVSSWNLRDRHMAETLDRLVDHLGRGGGRTKVVVWAHNSHLGDARATQMGANGELNLGQLAREQYGRDAVLIGFSTYHGAVTAASDWGEQAERLRVRPGLPGSYEALFHEEDSTDFLLTLRGGGAIAERLRAPRLQRAIGVIYRPESERFSHYFDARLSDQFDALIHIDETRAVEPLERTASWERGEVPATFPFAGEPIPGSDEAHP